jgi:SSS family solute:Na+ symporter
MAGSVLGLAVFFLDWFKETTGWSVPSMMATFYLFLVCSAVLVIVSLLRPHAHTAESEKLVWKNLGEALKGAWGPGILDYRLVALVLFLAMTGLYIVFR